MNLTSGLAAAACYCRQESIDGVVDEPAVELLRVAKDAFLSKPEPLWDPSAAGVLCGAGLATRTTAATPNEAKAV